MKDAAIEDINKAQSDLEKSIKGGQGNTESLSELRRRYRDLMEEHPNTKMIRDRYDKIEHATTTVRTAISEMQQNADLIRNEIMSTIHMALQGYYLDPRDEQKVNKG